jgi:leucyl aminopeptidase (aminopeptidase T)
MPTPKLTTEIIAAAIVGFEEQKRHIDTKIAELRALLPGGSNEPAATPEAPTRKRKKFSAAARKRMKEAQQRRWAKIKGVSEPPAPATQEAPKTKRKLSKAGRKAISEATKKRWRLQKAAAKKATPAVAKNVSPAGAAKRAQ